MKQFDVHVCLVSDQALPNFIPVLAKDFRPQRVILLATDKMKQKAAVLAEVMKRRCQVKTDIVDLHDEYDMRGVDEKIFDLLLGIDKEKVALNVTGGTKLMSIAAYTRFHAEGYPVFYFTAKDNRVLLLDDGSDGREFVLQPEKMKIEDYLELHGYPVRRGYALERRLQYPQAERETHGLLPFGWVLIEIDPQGDNAALKQWCSQNSSHLADTAAIMQNLAQMRQEAIERKQAQQARAEREAAEKAAQAEAERQAQAAREAALAAMPPEERLIAQWQQQLENFTFDSRNQQAHTEFYQAFSQALQQAADTFERTAQQKTAEAFTWKQLSSKQAQLFAGKREKEIKAILRRLRGEQ